MNENNFVIKEKIFVMVKIIMSWQVWATVLIRSLHKFNFGHLLFSGCVFCTKMHPVEQWIYDWSFESFECFKSI